MRKPATNANIEILLFCSLLVINAADAQPRKQLVTVVVAPERADWTYKTGDSATFGITVLQAGNPVRDASVRYEIGPEKLPPTMSKAITLKDGTARIDGGTMADPGFLRCRVTASVNGKDYVGLATAAFDPLSIQPTTDEPEDFLEFWKNAKAEAAKVPLDARLTLLPERCTETVNVYHVNIQNHRSGSRIYGILCKPKKLGTYPALLRVPGAGARPYAGDIAMAEAGIITLTIGIHGVPVTMDRSVYTDMMRSSISGYWYYNLDDRDRYYYKRVYLGCVRAVDYLFTLPEFDGERLAVAGGSQGGALSIVTAALEPRIKWLAPVYPALSDLTGYLHNRAGGWPHMFNENNRSFNAKPDKIAVSKYYDVVNFARHVKVPGMYSWGFNDTVCPPTSMYAAYNVITAPKELLVAQETGHWTFPEQRDRISDWLRSRLLQEPGDSGARTGDR